MEIMINKQKNRASLWVILVFFFAALILMIFLLGENGIIDIKPHAFGLQFDLLCVLLTISLVIILIVYYLKRKKIDLFEFPVWFSLNIYIQVILNVWLLQRDFQFYSPWTVYNPEKIAVHTVLLVWGSLIIVWLAYFLGIRHIDHKTEPRIIDNPVPRLKLMGVVWFLTWLIDVYFTVTGAQGYLSSQNNFTGGNYIFFVNLINDLLTFNLMINYFKTPTNLGKIWIIFACSSGLLIGLILGTKSAIFVFLYLVMSYFYAHNRLPKKFLIVGFVVLLFIVPIVTTFRINLFNSGYSRSSGASIVERIPVLQKTITDIFDHSIVDLVGQTQTNFETRQSSIFEVTAAFLVVHPKIQPFVFVDLLESIATTIIPRFIWPDKPTARPNIYNISTNYLGAKQELSFAASGQIADAYRIGGILFLIIWLVFIAWFTSILYKAGPAEGNIYGTGFYLLVITTIITYDDDVFSTLMRLLQFGIILFIMNKYVFFNHKSSLKNIAK